ncbi:MAG: RIP metalloprotease RseP [Lachnospiraceae bacterium]|jgi:regulator of sigma E protease|nr:RIP metalloprotease RseP [Lachnospiraceae bacterium]MCI1726513.1 RIP metalloprotease RseP [Lachnospiraceae bacterium]
MKWIIAVLIFGLLIIFHEFGHFLLAKINGVDVEEFSVGFGPRIVSTVFHGTRYSLKILPFGGSCLMKGMLGDEDEDGEPAEPEPGSFNSVSIGKRAAIIAAGPIFNFILAFIFAVVIMSVVGYDPAEVISVESGSPAAEAGLETGDTITKFMGDTVEIGRDVSTWIALYTLKADDRITMTVRRGEQSVDLVFSPEITEQYRMGITYNTGSDQAEVSAVSEGSPLSDAGVKAGDVITSINGTAITTSDSLSTYLSEHPLTGDTVTITFVRDGLTYEKEVTPVMSQSVSLGFDCNLGRVGTDAPGVLKYSFIEVNYWIKTTVRSLGQLFTGRFSVNDLSGPVGIVDVVGTTYEQSKSEGALMTWMNMFNLIILLSANLGVMNLLPIPAIDGGRLLFLLIEAVRGKPMNRKVENAIQLVSMALLMLLMVYVMYHDIANFY